MSSQSDQAGYIPNSVKTGDAACEGRKSITTIIDFSIGLTFRLDLTQIQQMQNWIRSVQCLYVDNLDNTVAKTITMGVTNQRITVPAGAQGYFPILQTNPPVLQFQSENADTLKIQILNFFLPPAMWGVNGSIAGVVETSDAILDSTVTSGFVNTKTNPVDITPADDSGSIAAANTPQLAIAANPTRKRFTIFNPDTATETLYMRWGSAAAGPIPILPGGGWDESGTSCVQDAIYLEAATIGHDFTAYES